MNNIFKDIRKNGRTLIYNRIVLLSTDVNSTIECEDPYSQDAIPSEQQLVLGIDINSGEYICVPVLEFLNYFEPKNRETRDAALTFDNLMNYIQNEDDKEDICALHGGTPNAER